VARNGLVRGNTVMRARSSYGGRFAAGIYVDGGRDIVIENNVVSGCDLGIEIGAENPGLLTQGIVVRNNVIYRNEKVGITFGGYDQSVGRANANEFRGNTLFENNTVGSDGQGTYFSGGGVGEISITFAQDNIVENNIIVAGPENVFIVSYDPGGSVNNSFDYNLFFSADGVAIGEFSLNDNYYEGLAAWRSGTGQDLHSLIGDPLFSAAPSGDVHVASGSPAIDAGNPAYLPAAGETDLDGSSRLVGSAIDIGADEQAAAADMIFADGFESGDPLKWSQVVP
jgi:parallel beta-helix repeat protein